MRVLVVGGAGYIGSAAAVELLEAGHHVTVYDSLIRGHRAAVPEGARLVVGDIADAEALRHALHTERFDAAMHFGAFIEAGESMRDPGAFFANNVAGTITLVNELLTAGVERLVFSSSAGVYGEPERNPIDEEHPTRPVNVYGETKLIAETVLRWYGQCRGLRWVALRYFNAAGATADRGEDHHPETHLIPIVLEAAAGKRPAVPLFGNDYPTRDGTCVRDYVHIADLAQAHRLALAQCDRGGGVFNLGSGAGFSNAEVVEAARRVTDLPIAVEARPRRPGDPAELVASSERARRVLGWRPAFPKIETIVESAWRWHRDHPHGYGR
jgi:UDP-glucose 4-epimerase